MRELRVAIVDEHDVFRRGIEACLRDDESISIVASTPEGPPPLHTDVAVMSPRAAVGAAPDCPLKHEPGVLAAAERALAPRAARARARAVRSTLSGGQSGGLVLSIIPTRPGRRHPRSRDGFPVG